MWINWIVVFGNLPEYYCVLYNFINFKNFKINKLFYYV